MILHALEVGALRTNCYIVGCERARTAIVIDPGGDAETILGTVREHELSVERIVLTHFHFDHVMAAKAVQAGTGASLVIHEKGAALLSDPPDRFKLFAPSIPRDLSADATLRGGDTLRIGDIIVSILHTPGHSLDSISLWLPEELSVFCGDLLFREGIGRTDFPGSSHAALVQSIHKRLYVLPDGVAVYPGHGPPTTIGHEKRHNPWVGLDEGATIG